jgi:hypothetical protein
MKTFLGKNSEVVILKHTLTTNPIGELVIEKTFTGTSPSFSGDDIYSQIKITNI